MPRKNKQGLIESPSPPSIDSGRMFSLVSCRKSLSTIMVQKWTLLPNTIAITICVTLSLSTTMTPQGVLQIVNMILHFHPQLRAVTLRCATALPDVSTCQYCRTLHRAMLSKGRVLLRSTGITKKTLNVTATVQHRRRRSRSDISKVTYIKHRKRW